MTKPQPDLADLLASRICHDLISPVGAIGNGVELIELAGGQGGPELQLIAESARNASARLRLFRIAFGAARPQQSVAGAEMAAILGAVYGGPRLRCHWQAADGMPRPLARLVALAVLCLESALPGGGEITVETGGGSWKVTARGPGVRLDEPLLRQLEGEAPAPEVPDAAHVQFALAPRAAAACGRRISVEKGDDALRLLF